MDSTASQPRFTVCMLLSLLLAGASSGEDRVTTPNIETIVQQMAQARADNQAILRAYTVKRNYTLVGKDSQDTQARVLVQISFTPPSAKKFVIQESSGTGFGERAVRQMLEHETAIVKNHDSTELSLANYKFRLVREELCRGRRCFVLAITPRRKDKILLVGRIWVDAATYLLHRAEGVPAKGAFLVVARFQHRFHVRGRKWHVAANSLRIEGPRTFRRSIYDIFPRRRILHK